MAIGNGANDAENDSIYVFDLICIVRTCDRENSNWFLNNFVQILEYITWNNKRGFN